MNKENGFLWEIAQKHSLIDFYKELHENPELSWQEYQTTKKILKNLKKNKEIEIKSFLDERGVVAIINNEKGIKNHSQKDGSYSKIIVGLRADIDALPIQEKTQINYASKKQGIMHACGHDMHTTILVSTLLAIANNKELFKDITIYGFFQPAEEVIPSGAKVFLEEIKDKIKLPDVFLAFHVSPDLLVGEIGVHGGPFMASSDEVIIKIKGKGGHATLPHITKNPIIPASAIIQNIQNILNEVRKPQEECILAITSIKCGNAFNVIDENLEMKGTLRTFSNELREKIKRALKKYVESICKAFEVEGEIIFNEGAPVLVNSEKWIKKIVEIFNSDEKIRTVEVPKRFGSEDFAYFLNEREGCLLRLGCSENIANSHPLHSPYFLPSIKTIHYGVYALLKICRYLQKNSY